MTPAQQIVTIALCVAGTMATRFLPFLIFSDKRPTPKYIQYLGRALPGAVFGLLVSSLWLLYFYGGTIMGGFGPFKFDSSELPIITLYAIYIPIYIALLKRKDLSGFRGKVMPVLAILCSLFMVFAAIYSHKINVVYYLIVFVVIEVIGAFFKSGRKA